MESMRDKEAIISCCLCGDSVNEMQSHNARPVKDGRCCNICNMEIVIPKRFGIQVLEIKPIQNEKKNNIT